MCVQLCESIDDGGTNDLDNLVLVKNDPYHTVLTNAQRGLVKDLAPAATRTVEFPVLDGIICPPTVK